jgi:IMP dehydrogenase
MPITAGDAAPGAAMKAEITDYAKALEVAETYATRDGLDVDTLIDSDKHGALTYNDFLILPGYIGKPNPAIQKKKISVPMTNRFRLPRFRCLS